MYLWLAVVGSGCAQALPEPEPPAAAQGSAWQQPLHGAECRRMQLSEPALHGLARLQAQLAAQGLALRIQGCPQVASDQGRPKQLLAVRVRVVHGAKAVDLVRGPLADGEDVDMGSQVAAPGLPALAAHPVEEDLSPDVLFNRQWLRGQMQAHGFEPVAGWWWGFVPKAR